MHVMQIIKNNNLKNLFLFDSTVNSIKVISSGYILYKDPQSNLVIPHLLRFIKFLCRYYNGGWSQSWCLSAVFLLNNMESVRMAMATAKYTLVGETLRYVIPTHMQCSFGCGGRACKYEDPSRWSEDQQAIRGLYSSWITDNLLAMARPSTEIIERYNVIDQFQRCGLRTVVNLQRPGEHADCGNPLEPDSGFTYRPETFMEAGIYFYNFGWNDYGVASLSAILDMVKVMSFSMQEGKIAVHCHAGLGRTGVLLACFLVFTSRMTANQAILLVRSKRPNSIQTRGQLACVQNFAKFLIPLRNVFAYAHPRANPVTLPQFLIRQKHILHGDEARQLRYIPKLMPLICKLLLDIAENRQVIEEDVLEVPDVISDDESSVCFNARRSEPQISSHIRVGAINFSLPRLPGPFAIPKHSSQLPLHYAHKNLSYSDSNLLRHFDVLNISGNHLPILANSGRKSASQINMSPNCPDARHGTLRDLSTYGSCSSLWELKSQMEQEEGHSLLKTRCQFVLQRSQSLGVSKQMEKMTRFSKVLVWKNGPDGNKRNHKGGDDEDDDDDDEEDDDDDEEEEEEEEEKVEEVQVSEVPFLTIQSELSLEARRLLVAQSLALDLNHDGKEEHVLKVRSWQMDLNSQGGFERLCLERDPFVLTGILWSWFEQLKEPVISVTDVQTLKQQNTDQKIILNSLPPASRETLLCVLDCFAHLLVMPEEVEEAFVERIIKAFTWIENVADGQDVYETMTCVLKRVLRDLRRNAMDEQDTLQ
ncbi:protein tyrosine phosphatase domain-containing protein 1 isoform X2 [Neoarius graeffei]|uniref:protein tyrosine phosphatase domain-containing protein 1 isoform X2 n=1 Tax=Neoarius graeffei TaxID=443677 RepID=UPI00298C8A73|nr:protein tyrosine phosphatase domain-containing protein 1 isoform X2 [Neoarius graeffei]